MIKKQGSLLLIVVICFFVGAALFVPSFFEATFETSDKSSDTIPGIVTDQKTQSILANEVYLLNQESSNRTDSDNNFSEVDPELFAALEDDELLTRAELARLSFEKILLEAQKTLPTRKQMESLSDAELMHDVPATVVEAAALIGQLKATVDRDEALADEAGSFFLECAKSAQVLTSIRALCLTNLLHLAESHIAVDMVGVSEIPNEVIDLSSRLREGESKN